MKINNSNNLNYKNVPLTKFNIIKIKIFSFIECSFCLFVTWLIISFLLCIGFSILIYFSFLDLKNWIPSPKEIPKNNVPLFYDIEIQIDTSNYEPLKTFSGIGTITFKCDNECSNYFYINIGKNINQENGLFTKLLNDGKNNETIEIVGSRYHPETEIKTIVLNEKFEPNINYTFSFSFYGTFDNAPYLKLFSYTGQFSPRTYGAYFGVPEGITNGLRYIIPSLDDNKFISYFRWVIIRRSIMKSLSNSVLLSSEDLDEFYQVDKYKETIPIKTYENIIVIYQCNCNIEKNSFSNVNITSCFRTSIQEKILSIDRIHQFMCEESNEIGKMDVAIIPGVQTIYRPGIAILNEGETISEAKTLNYLHDNINKIS
ncbi:Peptidase M1, membrane alanine aminopeptidase, N-terminal domain-containing protein [Strongyloides ratti]|uniref:Peptidase M1, membrane alanine aminopeptidase, N-terminal domain-containing protein n=1 Tax=Strongyloides ratti TaxID=34506 RepID=A0A090LGP7_STRRB|nr:Peptidase M1, membrane alanine aminopeptidase, N-terminal domain-containing protein [Strongyloides ratti]CEF68971.1 Peptidase M1, membrane alanine aminopeptidase, N-terminal domain-containing protein [Strongyloides ratti]